MYNKTFIFSGFSGKFHLPNPINSVRHLKGRGGDIAVSAFLHLVLHKWLKWLIGDFLLQFHIKNDNKSGEIDLILTKLQVLTSFMKRFN